jgi:hypothetical protein
LQPLRPESPELPPTMEHAEPGGVAKPNSALRAAERRELTLAGVVEQEGHLSQQQERLRQRVR